MSDLDKHLRVALDAMPEPLFILGERCVCVFANRAFFELICCGESGSLPLTESFWPEAEVWKAASVRIDTDLIDTSGKRISCTLVASDLGMGMRLFRALAASCDTEHLHTQRLMTLGMLAGGIAHDFNNVLAGILGHISYLKTILPTKGEHCESLHAIEEGGKKASSLTQQILNFSKLNLTESPALVDGCALVSQTWKLLRGSIPPEFNLEYQVPESPLYLRAVEGKLAQVLINLVVNARDALSTGGTIEIALNPCSEKERVCELFGEKAEPANYAVLRVTDNGHGMSQDVLARAFEPYFSTKKDRGTGLGLSTVLTIVRSLGGAIDVHSQPGAGTEVEVFLPLAEESAQTEAVINSEPSQPLAGSGKVLVVDDEDPVRNVLSLSLLHLGYQVELAASGREALDKFASTAGSFDLVILDMLMPHISGDEVFFRMREINPKVRVLIISGYSSEEAVQRILQNGGKGFMQKPFTIEELSRKVRECLETG